MAEWRHERLEGRIVVLDPLAPELRERLDCRRVEYKTDARNERSRAALEALPARSEGVHRKHILVREEESRDSTWYSLLDDGWPAVRDNLRRRLARV